MLRKEAQGGMLIQKPLNMISAETRSRRGLVGSSNDSSNEPKFSRVPVRPELGVLGGLALPGADTQAL